MRFDATDNNRFKAYGLLELYCMKEKVTEHHAF